MSYIGGLCSPPGRLPQPQIDAQFCWCRPTLPPIPIPSPWHPSLNMLGAIPSPDLGPQYNIWKPSAGCECTGAVPGFSFSSSVPWSIYGVCKTRPPFSGTGCEYWGGSRSSTNKHLVSYPLSGFLDTWRACTDLDHPARDTVPKTDQSMHSYQAGPPQHPKQRSSKPHAHERCHVKQPCRRDLRAFSTKHHPRAPNTHPLVLCTARPFTIPSVSRTVYLCAWERRN